MTAAAYALVTPAGLVDNVIVWDGADASVVPQGHTAVALNGASAAPGYSYANGAFTPPPVNVAAKAQADLAVKIAAGATIASTGTPAVNGTYPIDPATQAQVQAISLYIQVNGKFPAGQTALPWADSVGALHTFPTTALWQAFATALGDYVTALHLAAQAEAAGQPATWPSLPLALP